MGAAVKGHVARHYQTAATDAFQRSAVEATGRGIVKLPTGTGKTFTAALVAQRFLAEDPDGRILFLAPRDELVKHARRAFEEAIGGNPDHYGLVHGRFNQHGRAIVFSTYQTLTARASQDTWRDQIDGYFDLIVCDECHHLAKGEEGKDWRTGLRLFYARAVKEGGRPPRVLGLSATPARTDGEDILDLFPDGLVYNYPIARAIADGYLCPLVTTVVPLPLDFSKVTLSADGDYNEVSAAKELRRVGAAKATAEAVAARIGDRRAIVFTASVDQAKRTSKRLVALGVRSDWVDGLTATGKRRSKLKAFARGELQVICNCGVLTEGYDDPPVSMIVVSRLTRSAALFTQMVGRGLRNAPGKDNCLLVDMVGAWSVLGLDDCDEFVGPDPDDPFAGRGRGEGNPQEGDPDDIDLVDAYIAASQGLIEVPPEEQRFLDVVLERWSPNAWVQATPGCYTIDGRTRGERLVVIKLGDRWQLELWTRGLFEVLREGAPGLLLEHGDWQLEQWGLKRGKYERWRFWSAVGGILKVLGRHREDALTRSWTKGEASDQISAGIVRNALKGRRLAAVRKAERLKAKATDPEMKALSVE